MLYLSGIILSLFLSFLIFTKRNKATADYILGIWLIAIATSLVTRYYTESIAIKYPTPLVMGFSLPLLQGPFLFLYVKYYLSPRPFQRKDLLHFLPFMFATLMFFNFYLLPLPEQMKVWEQKGRGYELQISINLYAIYLSGIVYVILSYLNLFRYRKNIVHQFSNIEKINYNWLLYLIIGIAMIWAIVLVLQEDRIIYGAASLFVLWLGYFGIKKVQAFQQYERPKEIKSSPIVTASIHQQDNIAEDPNDHIKYQKSPLSESDVDKIHEKLKTSLGEGKLFKDPDLTLNSLAKSLNVHPNHLSQVINTKEQKNFYELINEMRVDEFIELSAKPGNNQFTLLSLAFECGFNSKASFNRNFKKKTGLTPSEYLQAQKTRA